MPFRDLPGVVKCRFKRGECLMRAGELVEFVYYLAEGEILMNKGYESILSEKGSSSDIANLLVGILAVYNRNTGGTSISDFIAYTDCTAYRIPIETCKNYFLQHPVQLEAVLYYALDEYHRMLQMLQFRLGGSATVRLCALLLERSKVLEGGRQAVLRKCTNVEISKLLNIHKVTVSRMLRALKDEGIVERTPDGLIILEPERLKQYAENNLVLKYE